jgi:hypothetical protein
MLCNKHGYNADHVQTLMCPNDLKHLMFDDYAKMHACSIEAHNCARVLQQFIAAHHACMPVAAKVQHDA